jgi:chromosomal replication initiation ATPase DnaA
MSDAPTITGISDDDGQLAGVIVSYGQRTRQFSADQVMLALAQSDRRLMRAIEPRELVAYTSIKTIISRAEREFDVTYTALVGKSRQRDIVNARYAVMYAGHRAGHSLEDVGRALNRHHTTVLHGEIRATELAKIIPDYAEKLHNLTKPNP